MEIILKKKYKKLGSQGDIVKVKPGFGRNYLITQGVAVVADKSSRKVVLENQRQAAKKATKLKHHALENVKLLEKITLQVAAKAGDEGKIFGSVTPLQIAKALKEQGVVIDYTLIELEAPIKKIGNYEAKLMLHQDVVHTLKFEVFSL